MESIQHKEIFFFSDGNKLQGKLIFPLTNRAPLSVLFIHGGGKTIGDRQIAWQEHLAKNGFFTMSFFCRGVDKSEGSFEDGSLNNRLCDAEAALLFLRSTTKKEDENIIVIASSMGGHVACRLVQRHPKIKKLILQSAAAYGKEAENKKLDRSFTNTITKQNSWKNSPAFDALTDYKGEVMVVYSKQDSVIPQEIQKKYSSSAKITDTYILDTAHAMLRPNSENEQRSLHTLFSLSLKFLKD